MTAKPQVPAVDGWFTTGDEPRLLGSRCTECGTSFFPPERLFCRNPGCDSTRLEEVPLGRRGTVWSFTVNRYPAPPPFPQRDPFEPYGVAAVELPDERMIVLGQIARDTDPATLRVGSEVELVVEPFYADDEREYLVWKWRAV